jgi:hypothetical protein
MPYSTNCMYFPVRIISFSEHKMQILSHINEYVICWQWYVQMVVTTNSCSTTRENAHVMCMLSSWRWEMTRCSGQECSDKSTITDQSGIFVVFSPLISSVLSLLPYMIRENCRFGSTLVSLQILSGIDWGVPDHGIFPFFWVVQVGKLLFY